MVVKPHKSHNREKKALPQIGQFANSQVGRAVLHLYVTVKSLVTKKEKKRTNIDSLDSTVNMTFIDGLNS